MCACTWWVEAYKREREGETNLAAFQCCGDLVRIITTHKSMTKRKKEKRKNPIQNREQDTDSQPEKEKRESILVTLSANMTNCRIKNLSNTTEE